MACLSTQPQPTMDVNAIVEATMNAINAMNPVPTESIAFPPIDIRDPAPSEPTGTHRARKTNSVRILLKADAGWTDKTIAEALSVSIPTIQRVWQRFVEQSFEAALNPTPSRRKYQRLLDGVQEAHLIALACNSPPQGYQHWRTSSVHAPVRLFGCRAAQTSQGAR